MSESEKQNDQLASVNPEPVDPTRIFYRVEEVAEEGRQERRAEAEADEEAELEALCSMEDERKAAVSRENVVSLEDDEWI